jgi:hypothetical protein
VGRRHHHSRHPHPSLRPPQTELVLKPLHRIKRTPSAVDNAKPKEFFLGPRAGRSHLSKKCGNPAKEILFMTDYRVAKGEAQEDQITASIEKFTAQIPSSVYLALALGSMATSLAFQAAKKQHEALFIGQWAAPFLILGIYNKLVKIHGSDGTSSSGLSA